MSIYIKVVGLPRVVCLRYKPKTYLDLRADLCCHLKDLAVYLYPKITTSENVIVYFK